MSPKRWSEVMKTEDWWLIGILIFCVLFVGSFGWGLWG